MCDTTQQHNGSGRSSISGPRTIVVNEAILGHNDAVAAQNRAEFKRLQVLALNVLSSPGSGKTTFIQRTIADNNESIRCGVIVGDLATDNDARRLHQTGAPVVQLTTGTLCHLEAEMIARALPDVDPSNLDLLVIENVGNLVCPSAYDLGEDLRVVLISTTEGEDKPLKYPSMFRTADVVVINKMDIADVVGFDCNAAVENIRATAPDANILEVSARTGAGMPEWYAQLTQWISRKQG